MFTIVLIPYYRELLMVFVVYFICNLTSLLSNIIFLVKYKSKPVCVWYVDHVNMVHTFVILLCPMLDDFTVEDCQHTMGQSA